MAKLNKVQRKAGKMRQDQDTGPVAARGYSKRLDKNTRGRTNTRKKKNTSK